MAKKKIDFDKLASGLFKRTEVYADRVRQHYVTAVDELLKLAATANPDGSSGAFSFADNTRLSNKANEILRGLYSAVYNEIQNGVKAEWEFANVSCDALITSLFGKGIKESGHFARWFSRNQEAMDAFLKRKGAAGGLNLSKAIWKYTGDFRTEMETALSISLGQGDSASTVSRKVRHLLQHPDDMFRRFRVKIGDKVLLDEHGNPILDAKGNPMTEPVYGRRWKKKVIDPQTGEVTWQNFNPRDYHTGRGVYRSSYKNAMRLTRTETNMAYRTSEQERWQQLEFVVGYEIKTSNNHPIPDICDELKGKYPKSFTFRGWHPQCRCYCVPILANEDEFINQQQAILDGEEHPAAGSVNEITRLPENFTNWMDENEDRIKDAEDRGTLPYFITDNKDKKFDADPLPIPTNPDIFNPSNKKHAVKMMTAKNVLAVAAEYPEIDVTDLTSYIAAEGSISTLEAETKAIAQKILAVKQDEKALSALIPDVHEWKKQFTSSELHAVYNAVEARMARETFSTLEEKKRWLETEIKWVGDHKKYKTWEVAQGAYKKELKRVENLIDVRKLVADTQDALSFASITKSPAYKSLADEVRALLSTPDVDAALVRAKADSLLKDYKVRHARFLKAEADKTAAKEAKKKEKIRKAAEVRHAKRDDAAIHAKWDVRRLDMAKERANEILASGKLSAEEKKQLESIINGNHTATHDTMIKAIDLLNAKSEEFAKKYGLIGGYRAETLDEIKKRLGTDFPATLEHLDEAIAKFAKNKYKFAGDARTYASEIEQMMRHIFETHDLGMNIDDDLLETVLNSKFKNTFEVGGGHGYVGSTKTSGPIETSHSRLSAAHNMFGLGKDLSADQLARGEYEKYGLILDHDKVRSAQNKAGAQYGNVEVRFKKEKVTCTWTAGDSLCEDFQPSLVSDPKAVSFDHMFHRRRPDEFTTFDPTDFIKFRGEHIRSYLELQYHGQLTVDCVESLTFPYDLTTSKYLDVAKKWKAKGVKIFYVVGDDLFQL